MFVVLWWHLRIAFAMLYTDAFKGKKIKLEYALFINSLQYFITVLSSSHQLTHSVIPKCNEEDTITKTLPGMRCWDLEGFRARRSADQTVYRLTWSNNSSPTETTLPQTFRLPVPSNHRAHLCVNTDGLRETLDPLFFFNWIFKTAFVYLFVKSQSMWDVSSPTRDQTHVSCIGSTEPEPLDCRSTQFHF